MNNKGFAITTIIYAVLILLSLSMFVVLAILRTQYDNEKTFIIDINEEITTCLKENNCFEEE